MKSIAFGLLLAAATLVSGAARADSDDAKWVAKCIADNADAKVSKEVVVTYCTCMNGKMESSETQSITQWEKSHPTERTACEAEAGWK
ncbi:MAG: hypothetical protein GC191_17295 [Azospirillum sp.]|nr:hypothetical protein [Azospirillum sp.]